MAQGQRHLFQRFADFGTGRLPKDKTLKQGRYVVQQRVGQGGMGAVYLAYDVQQGNKLVAVKEMSQSSSKDEEELRQARTRFQHEANLLGKLAHPNLPHVYDSFEDANRSYLVMDFITGKTLWQILKQTRGNALPVEQVIAYGLQLCDVLAYLHKHHPPVIFRDLKPSNIIVRDDGQLFLIDFGIARFWQQDSDTEVFVSPGYSPPEQRGGQSTPLSDIFSLGATLHHCLTGYHPAANTQAHQYEFRPLDFFTQQAPPELSELIKQMVQINPTDRPARIEDVQMRLQAISNTLIASIRLSSSETYDPYAVTYYTGLPAAGSVPKPRRSLLLAMVGMALATLGRGLFGGLTLMLKAAQSIGLGSALRQSVVQWRSNVGLAIRNWSWDRRIWSARFLGTFFFLLLLILGNSLFLWQHAPDAFHLIDLTLIFGLFCLLAANLSDKRLHDYVLRSIFSLMMLGLVIAGLTLQALPDMVHLEQAYLTHITLNQLFAILLLLGAIVCLLRPAKRLAWVDQIQLGFLAASCALLHYGFAEAEVAQLPFLTFTTAQAIWPFLVWGLVVLALLAIFRFTQPFRGWSRFTLFLVTLAFAPLQYAFGYHELQIFLAGSTLSNSILERLAQANVFLVFIPLCCALLACFTPPAQSSAPGEYHPGLMTRLALFLLTLVVAALLSQSGQQIKLALLPNTAFPLSITILSPTTLYQLLEPLLALLTFIALLRLRGSLAFTWLDHALLLSLAFIGALFDSAYWQAQVSPSALPMDQHLADQQFTAFANQIPAYLIYLLLACLPLLLLALALCHIQQRSRASIHLDNWLKRFQTLLKVVERLLILCLLAIAFILQGFFGSSQTIIAIWIKTQQFTDTSTTLITLLTVSVLLLLSIFGLIVLARLIAPARSEIGGVERWASWLAALACLLLIQQDPHVNALPLLTTSIQLTGNLWHWSTFLLNLVFAGSLILTIIFARLWLRRGFFNRYRALMQPTLLLALVCVFLQFLWPIFLPFGLTILTANILLASQIEKAA